MLGISLVMGIALIWLIYKRKNEAKREAGAIRQQSEEKIGQLSEDLIGKERELTSKTIFINQKNQLLERLIKELDELKKSDVSAQSIQHLQVQLARNWLPTPGRSLESSLTKFIPASRAVCWINIRNSRLPSGAFVRLSASI